MSSSTPSSSSTFQTGSSAKRSLRKLLQTSSNPAQTIEDFQKSNSLHSMFAQAFRTTPVHLLPSSTNTRSRKRAAVADANEDKGTAEPFQPESALTFLHHMGVSRYEVHKKIADALLKNLEEEISRTKSKETLLKLLRGCWAPVMSAVELRPVLIALIKKLGDETPNAVLLKLAEREGGELKYGELLSQFNLRIRRLVWEADWGRVLKEEEDGKGSVLYDKVRPSFEKYVEDGALVTSANGAFVGSVGERRVATQSRRGVSKAVVKDKQQQRTSSSEAVALIKEVVGDRPKLLAGVLSMLIAQHGTQSSDPMSIIGGSKYLICSLVSDILLSYGQLPRVYEHLYILANVLDNVVKSGIIQDDHIAQIQGCLRVVFQEEDTTKPPPPPPPASTEPTKPTTKPPPTNKKKKYSPDQDTAFISNLLQKAIAAALDAMKQADPQCLFLNPVTDEIAPGYSSVIKQPMCMSAMHDKLQNYKTLQEFEKDVQLMFQNCIKYNIGNDGTWFRGEARRQNKLFKENILTQAKDFYKKELAKRKKTWEKTNAAATTTKIDKKRKSDAAPPPPAPAKKKTIIAFSSSTANTAHATTSSNATKHSVVMRLTSTDITPLKGTPKPKKAKKETDDDRFLPSLPTLASMLLADPFVVRILLDKVLRCVRSDVLGKKSLPASHATIPSLLQFLFIAQSSTQLASISGRKYFVPSPGFRLEDKTSEEETLPTDYIPFLTLRKYMPLLSKLQVDTELDSRTVPGGDLYDASTSSGLPRRDLDTVTEWTQSPESIYRSLVVVRAMVQASFIYLLLPGNSNELAIKKQFPRYVSIFNLLIFDEDASSGILEKPFLVSICRALLRHKSKLPPNTRDLIIDMFSTWIQKLGMESYAHETFIWLLNEWASLGNLIMPRDKLLQVSEEVCRAASSEEAFAEAWIAPSKEFTPIREQYERMLNGVPEGHASQWKEKMGIDDESLERLKKEMGLGEEGDAIEVEKEVGKEVHL